MRDWQQSPEGLRLQDAYVATRYWLGAMSLVSVASFSFLSMALAQWTDVMDTAGFADSPPLQYTTALTTCYVVPIVMYAVLKLAKPQRGFLGRPFVIRCVSVAGFLAMATAVVSMGLVTKLIPYNTALHLIHQTDAVANFNRGYCHAWCRHADATLVMIMRGQCGPVESSVFDAIVHAFDVATWCKQAIDEHNCYELRADLQGMSPFAGLKAQTRQRLLHTHTEKLQWLAVASTIISCWVLDHTRTLANDLAGRNDD